MNLLSILLRAMLSNNSMNSLSGSTGASNSQLQLLVKLALPLLLKAMTQNASSQDGALSLLGALQGHTNKDSMAKQIGEADTADGEKIIGHILGDNQPAVISSLAGDTGMNESQVSQALGLLAPGLLSGLSAATTGTAQSTADNAFDMGSLLGMFGGHEEETPVVEEKPEPAGGLLGLFGKIFGAQAEKEDTGLSDGTVLLQTLAALMQK